MVKSGFFNSVNGDRVYNADDLGSYFDGLINDGVFKYYAGELQVTAGTGMSVSVASGKAMIGSKFIVNTDTLTLEIDAATAQPRYDAVVVGVDLTNRTGDIYVKKGTAASTPEYPAMADGEKCLAYVYIGAGATSVTVTDKRSDTSVCGYATLTNLSASMSTLRNNVSVTTANTATVQIGISAYNASADTLFVYLNGLLLIEGTDYTVSGTGANAYITLANPITSGTGGNAVTFIVLKMTI